MKNKSKSHNHPLSRLLLLLVFTLFIISCKKNEETILKKDTIQEAQEWFRSKTINQNLNTSMFRNKGINKLSALSPQSFASIPANADHNLNIEWENAKQYQSNDSTIIEVPVNTKGIFKFNTEPASDKKISINKSFTRVLLIETPLKTEGYFMTIISSDTYLAAKGSSSYNNSYLKKESGFEGTIVYHDLNGKMLNAFSINKLKPANKQASIKPTPKDKVNIAIPDNCVGTPVYEVIGTDCYDVGAYYTYCENVYSIYLGSTGCGSGGGITNPNAPGGGGGGGDSNGNIVSNTIPENPYMPGQDHPAINPKDYVKCFGNIPDAGASYKIAVQVQEPFENSDWNYGKNGVGHTAITLTKTGSNGESVTQTIGFYPAGNKFEGPSKIVNNGNDMDFTIQINFDLGANSETFNSILNYISNPPKIYELAGVNCTYFINEGCKKGNISLPSAWSNIAGFMDPLNVVRVMTPAGLAQSMRALKNNGDNRIKTNPGKAPSSKGPC